MNVHQQEIIRRLIAQPKAPQVFKHFSDAVLYGIPKHVAAAAGIFGSELTPAARAQFDAALAEWEDPTRSQ